MTFIQIDEPRRPPVRGWALWALGFRPFYLLASVFAALSIPLWAWQFTGHLARPYLAGPAWHAHEMVFGFALAVIVGFLFTAGRTWSGQDTPTGWRLAALAALWLAARWLVLTPWAWAAMLANVAFPLASAVALWRTFRRGTNRRNDFFAGLLLLMAAAAAAFHLGQLGIAPPLAPLGITLALDAVLFILAVMGGRVIPMFTNNGVPGAAAVRRPRIEQAALGLVLALMMADAAGLPAPLLAGLAGAAALAHGARWWGWQPWATRTKPLVWVLHAAYLWVPLHLVLRMLAGLGLVAPSLATHALTVGAIGGLVIGMLTRTARGHTARPLRADGFDVACYALVLAAAWVRVIGPLLAPAHLVPAVLSSAVLWAAGFALYALRYAPSLCRARLDGKPG